MLIQIFEKVVSLSVMASVMILIVFALKGLLRLKQGYIKKMAFVIMWIMVFVRLSVPFTLDSQVFQVHHVNPTQYVYQAVLENDIITSAKNTEQGIFSQKKQSNTESIPKQEKISNISSYESNQNDNKGYAILKILSVTWFGFMFIFLLLLAFIYITTLLKIKSLQLIEYRELESLKRELKITRTVKIKLSQEDIDTAVYGIFRPTIVISNKNISQIKHIVIHELVHIKSFDNLKKLFVEIVLSIHWFNPLVWISRHYFQKDIELACDEKVISFMGYEERKAYAESILFFASEHRKMGTKSFASFGENPVKGRIRNILQLKKQSIMKPVVSIAVTIFVLAGCMTNPIQQLAEKMVAYALEPNFVNIHTLESEKNSITDYYAVGDTVYYILSGNLNNDSEQAGYKIGKYNIKTGSNEIILDDKNSDFTALGLHFTEGFLFYCEKVPNEKKQYETAIIKYDVENHRKTVLFKPYAKERVEGCLKISEKGLSFDNIQINGSDDYLIWHEIYRNSLGECQDQLNIFDIKNDQIKEVLESNGNQSYANILDGYFAYQKQDPHSNNTLIIRHDIRTGKEISIGNILSSQPYSAYANEQYFVYKEDFIKGAEIVVHKIKENKDYLLWDTLSSQVDEKTLQEYRNGLWGINLIKDKLILTGVTNIILEVDLENFQISIVKEKKSPSTGFYQTKVSNNGATSLQQAKDDKGKPLNLLFYGKLIEQKNN